MIFLSDKEVDNDIYDYLHKRNAVELHLDHDYSDYEVDNMIMWFNNQGQWNLCPLNNKLEDPDYEQYRGPLKFILTEHVKSIFKANTQLASKFLHLPLRQHFKSRFNQLNHPRITAEYSIYTFF